MVSLIRTGLHQEARLPSLAEEGDELMEERTVGMAVDRHC
jgi:hypothetical protein